MRKLFIILACFNSSILGAQNVLKILSNNGVSKISYIFSKSSESDDFELIVSSASLGVEEYTFSRLDISVSYEEIPPFVTISCNSGDCIIRKDYPDDAKQAYPILLTNNRIENNKLFEKLKSFLREGAKDLSLAGPSGRLKKTSIDLRKMSGGTYGIKIILNGTSDTEFILDSGASFISINSLVFQNLQRKGTIAESDILNVIQSRIADGSIVDNLLVNIKSVKIGEYDFRNVRCIVSENPHAPLLLGQNILQKFSAISIDYESNKLHIID